MKEKKNFYILVKNIAEVAKPESILTILWPQSVSWPWYG